MRKSWLLPLLATTALLSASSAWSQNNADVESRNQFRATMERVERLRQRQDQEAFVDQAQLLEDGLPVSETNPLRRADPKEAERLYERALASPGPQWPTAAVRRAKILLNSDGGQVADERAAELLRRAAAMQNREAAYLLAGLMENGIGVPRDVAAARGLFQVALRQGHGPSGLALARLETDAAKANVFATQGLRLLFQDAKQGSADAARTLADHYRMTSDGAERLSVALDWYQRASDLGDAEASLRLGRMRSDPKSPLYQPQEARAAFEKAANRGSVEAALVIAEDPYNGGALGIPVAQAEFWLNRAIETKAPRALVMGAEIRSQFKRDEAKALLNEALKVVDKDPTVLVSLGRFLRNGDLIDRNLPLAISFFDQAAKQDATTALYEFARTVLSYPDATTAALQKIAIGRLQGAAERGHVKASVSLGDALMHGNGVVPAPAEALHWYQKAADGGSTVALIRLGDFYALRSDGVETPRALEWYRKAAEANSSIAMVRLGRMFREGRGVPQDYALAATWLSRAAAAGSGPAMLELSALYSRAGGPGHLNLAREALERAVRAGDARAPIALAKLYLARGERPLAEATLRRAAEGGNVEAALQLAEMYVATKAPDQIAQARRWLSVAEKAAAGDDELASRIAVLQLVDPSTSQRGVAVLETLVRKNNAAAMTTYAQALLQGAGIQSDGARAEALLRRAIQLGHDAARFVLAKAYKEGEGLPRDPVRAIALYREIYNDEPGDTKVLLALGDAYVQGEGVARDRKLATQFYALAAQNGDPEGQLNLGMAYLYGGGVEHDGARSERLLSQASEANLMMARLELGNAKASGMGAMVDPEGAFASFLRAAEAGSPEAMIEVARALRKGFGTQADPALAQTWLERAARIGSQDALYEMYRISAVAHDSKPQEAERWLMQAAQGGHPAAMYHLALRYKPSSQDQNNIDGNEWLTKAAQAGHWQAIKAVRKKKLPEPGDPDDDE
jgi:TPR repeat protein